MPRKQSKQLFRDVFQIAKTQGRKWTFNQSSLFLNFLAGNETYQCTPWSNPTYNVFGWQRPCYLLVGEGYASSFQSLLDDTEWGNYGVGKNPKCDNCMAHCGFEGTAVNDTFRHPVKALTVFLKGPRTHGPMAAEVPIVYQKPQEIDPFAVRIPLSQVRNSIGSKVG